MMLTLSQIDRAIFEALRRETVRRGFLPDIRTFVSAPVYEQAVRQWETNTGKKAIEIWGVANYEDRTSGKANNIVINRLSRRPGGLGGGTLGYAVQENEKYTKYLTPERSYELSYQVTYNTESTAYDRTISQIIGSALGSRKFLSGIDNTGAAMVDDDGPVGFWIMFQSEADTSGKDFMERTLAYAVREVFLEEETILATDLPAIETFSPTVEPVTDAPQP